MFKILIIDDLHPAFFKELETISGLDLQYKPNITKADALLEIPLYDGVVVRSKVNFNQNLLSNCPNLKLLARAGAGMDNIDEEFAKAKGITLLNAPEGNRDAVGEHAIAMLLGLFNKISTANQQIKSKQWLREANRGIELKGKTVGIIGFGNNGQAFAEKLKGFGVSVLAYDKYKSNFSTDFVQEVDLNAIQTRADVISLHIPLTSETHHFINADFVENCKNEIYLINCARGKLVNLAVVTAGLKTEKILGACLDVLENEDLHALNSTEEEIFNYLISNNNVILTPHVAGWTTESYERISKVLSQKINFYLNNSI